MSSVSMLHVLEQGPMLRTLGSTALATLVRRAPLTPSLPGPWVEVETAAPSRDLVRAFVKFAGGESSAYKNHLPPVMFPQWAIPVAARAMADLPYPIAKVLNAGFKYDVRKPLPQGERLHVKARLESIDDDGTRALVTTRVVTGTASTPDALIADIRAFVPLKKKEGKKAPAQGSSTTAREVAYLRLRSDAGLDFAKLTGDFNPIHWVAPYARAAGFRTCILHGFATGALAALAVERRVLSGNQLRDFDVRFTRPLSLPARVGIYVDGSSVFVADAPGAAPYLVGTFATERAS